MKSGQRPARPGSAARQGSRPQRGPTAPSPTAPEGAPATADFYANQVPSMPQLEAFLAQQQQELHFLVAKHYEHAKQLIVQREHMCMTMQIENQELRAKVAELRKVFNNASAEEHSTRVLQQRQHARAHGLLLRRDQDARNAEHEALELRKALASKQSGRTDDSRQLSLTKSSGISDGVVEEFDTGAQELVPPSSLSSPHKKSRPNSAKTVTVVQPAHAEVRSVRSPGRQLDVSSPMADLPKSQVKGGVDLLMSLQLPGQVYAEGNFLPKEEASSSEESELEKGGWVPPDRDNKEKLHRILDVKDRMHRMFQDKHSFGGNYRQGSYFTRIALHPIFEHVAMACILLNVLWIGIDTAINPADFLVDADVGIVVVENLFCVWFLAEVVIRGGAYASCKAVLKDWWLIFDGLLVVFMVLETWVLFLVMHVSNVDIQYVNPSMIRLLRVFRITRVARIFRILRALPELLILLKAIGVASRSVFFTMCLLTMCIYLFSIVCTNLGKDTRAGELYFNSLGDSMFTLFFYGMFGYDLPSVAGAAFADDAFLGIVISIFILCAPLTMLNLLIAVLCEVVGVMAGAEQQALLSQAVEEKLLIALAAMDANGDGDINLEEFIGLLERKDALLVFRELGIDVISLVESPELIFGVHDQLCFDDFVKQVLLLRDSNAATVKDIHQLRRQLVDEVGQVVAALVKRTTGDDAEKKKKNKKRNHAIEITRAVRARDSRDSLVRQDTAAAMGRGFDL